MLFEVLLTDRGTDREMHLPDAIMPHEFERLWTNFQFHKKILQIVNHFRSCHAQKLLTSVIYN